VGARAHARWQIRIAFQAVESHGGLEALLGYSGEARACVNFYAKTLSRQVVCRLAAGELRRTVPGVHLSQAVRRVRRQIPLHAFCWTCGGVVAGCCRGCNSAS